MQTISLAKEENYAILVNSHHFRQITRGDCAFRKVDFTSSFNKSGLESFIFRKRFPFRNDVEDL